MNIRRRKTWILFLCVLFFFGIIGCATAPDKASQAALRISKETLNDRLDDSSLIIIDVRLPRDWRKSGKKIKGAIQEDPDKFVSWVSRYPKTKTIVLY